MSTTPPPSDSNPVSDPGSKASAYTSRKLWFGIGTSIAIMIGGIFYAFAPGFRAAYDSYIMGLISVLGLYTGGNVATTHVITRNLGRTAASDQNSG